MRATTTSLLLCLLFLTPALGALHLETIEDHLENGYEQIGHEFGGIQLIRETEGLAEYSVYWPEHGFLSEPNHFLDGYSIILNSLKNPAKYNASNIITCNPGHHSDYFKFLPTQIGTIKIGESFTHSSPCFANNTVTLKLGDDANSVILEHTTENSASWTCSDSYFYATTQNYHITSLFFKGVHRTTFKGLSDSQMKEIQRDGFKVFRVCDSLVNIFPDVFKTILLFLGGLSANPYLPFIGSHPPFWMVSANIEFIKHATGYEWKPRANNSNVDLDASHIKSGDFFAITRFDGLDQIIEWGVGSHAGHSAVAMWIENELYVLESQAAWYWPRPNIQKNPYKQWLQYAENAGYQVTILPLKSEVQSKLNVSKALEWYNTVEGYPYGYHNFLFGWIDTEADSYPPVIDPQLVAPLFSILEGVVADVGRVFNEAVNFRLNTSNLTIPQMAEVISERNLTWPKVYAMPEQDSWRYSDGPSMVCSSFVVALWKAGGLFEGMEIQATEFTPRDAYSLTFIDPKPVLAQACLDNDPNATFCQVLGDYKMEFPQLSTVEPYSGMNERCPSKVTDDYFRPDGC